MADMLEHCAVNSPGDLETMQKTFGLVYDPDTLLWDPTLRTMIDLPKSIFWDWMFVRTQQP